MVGGPARDKPVGVLPSDTETLTLKRVTFEKTVIPVINIDWKSGNYP